MRSLRHLKWTGPVVVIVAVGQVGVGVVESGSGDGGRVSMGIRAEVREGVRVLGWLARIG